MTVAAYRQLADQIEQPFHLGITEAGGLRSGTVKSAIGLGVLLLDGIGDTIRVSLAADPVEEVKVGFDVLKSLRIRSKGVNFIACPSCSRQNFDVISTLNELERRLLVCVTAAGHVPRVGFCPGLPQSGIQRGGAGSERESNAEHDTGVECKR